MRVGIAVSAVLHFFIYMLMPQKHRVADESIEIELREIVTETPRVKRRLRGHKSKTTRSVDTKSQRLSADDILPRFHSGTGRFAARKKSRDVRAGKSFGNAGKGMMEELVEHRYYDLLYEKIDMLLHYPAKAGLEKRGGFVQVRVILDQNSKCIKKQLMVNGALRLLVKYVRDLVLRVCDEELINKPIGKNIIVDMSFEFDLTETHDETKKTFRKGIIENNMYFYRSFEKQKMKRIGDLFYIPILDLSF